MTTGTCEIDNFLRSERAAWQSVDVKGKSNWTWYSAAFGLVVAALVTSASFYAVFASIGETWAGFPIERSGKVGLRIFSSPAAAPSLPMFAERGRIIGISGHPVRDGVEARSFIRSQAPGTPLRYLAEEPGGGNSNSRFLRRSSIRKSLTNTGHPCSARAWSSSR